METLFCLPVWWRSYKKRWDLYCTVKTSAWALSSTVWDFSFQPKMLSCPWERSEECSEQCQWWCPLAFSHGLHSGCSSLHQCIADSVVLPCIVGSQCVHHLPRPSALKVFGFDPSRPLISPIFCWDFPSHPQISEGLHQGCPSGVLVRHNHPKHMEMVSTFGEGEQQRDHEERTNILGI